MAFTRLIAGPMNCHLGGFRSVPPSAFAPRNVAPQVLGTRAHMLAMFVCFNNPAPMVADYPVAYELQPGFDFLKLVPTWWDETRVLVGEIGRTAGDRTAQVPDLGPRRDDGEPVARSQRVPSISGYGPIRRETLEGRFRRGGQSK